MTREVLRTPRLVLRELGEDDLDFLAAMLADPEVMEFFGKRFSRQESEGWLRRQQERYARDGYGFWLAVERESGQPVGQAGLARVAIGGAEEPALGYLIHRPFWRRGLATEAARACLDHAFDVLGEPRVVCPVRPENAPSQGVARKLGMMPVGVVLYGGFEHLLFTLSQADRDARAARTSGGR
jgi:RimJ/RimL family protein N-acetyltransferase